MDEYGVGKYSHDDLKKITQHNTILIKHMVIERCIYTSLIKINDTFIGISENRQIYIGYLGVSTTGAIYTESFNKSLKKIKLQYNDAIADGLIFQIINPYYDSNKLYDERFDERFDINSEKFAAKNPTKKEAKLRKKHLNSYWSMRRNRIKPHILAILDIY